MKPKTLILMVVAVVCGLGASYMTSRLLAEREDRPAEAPVIPKVTLLVAKKNLEMHTAMKGKPEDFFVEKQFVKDEAPKEALKPEDLPKLKGKFLKRSLRKGDQVTLEDIMDRLGLTTLPAGYRAVGLRVNIENIAGGFASLPGSRVDIIWTGRDLKGQTFTFTLLEDVPVLAADTMSSPGENPGGAMPANTVTVALLPEDALKVALAQDTGSLRLVLRNIDDKTKSDLGPMTGGQMLGLKDGKKDEPKEHTPLKQNTQPDPPVAGGGVERPQPGDRKQEVDPNVKPETPKVAEKPEKPKIPPGWRKFTQLVRNGDEVKQYHYWLDQNGIIRPPPQMDADDEDASPPPTPVPPPAPGKGNKEEKKVGPSV